MFNRVKIFFDSLLKNYSFYSPGIFLILLGFMILLAPYLLVFMISSVFIFLGFMFIMTVRAAVREEREIRHFRGFVRDQFARWEHQWW